MSEDALAACLATRERETLTLRLGLGATECGEPPFDEQAPALSLMAWPWTEWPVYDEAIFEIDRRRIERWYRARGYYDARVRHIGFFVDDAPIATPTECTAEHCELSIRITVAEGEAVQVKETRIESDSRLPDALRAELENALALSAGERFDETLYENDKRGLTHVLTERGFARAVVRGVVELDRVHRSAIVIYQLQPGPLSRLGDVRVVGHDDLDPDQILAVAKLRRGDAFHTSDLIDAERAIYALGPFASVRVEPQLEGTSGSTVDVVIRVAPGRRSSLRLGVGVMSGVLNAGVSDEIVSVPEWDVHLRAAYRNESFLGGMRRLRIEERPRAIFLRRFPAIPASGVRFGNAFDLRFEQPRFVESRTTLFLDARSDLGPDPFYAFFRHVLSTKLGVRRSWFNGRLQPTLAIAHDVYDILDDRPPDNVSSYRLPFFEQQVKLDLRDDAQRPTRGAYFAVTAQEALRLGYGAWDYVRPSTEVRAYQRLPFRIVLAQRFAIAGLFVLDSASDLDAISRSLGPQEYRLRGGGANSNRGFAPGTLGVGIAGGKRRWEATLEARVPLGSDVGVVLFADAGDVSAGSRVRFNHLNTALGFGLRYFTAFAPIRIDLGWRVPAWRAIDADIETIDVGVLPSAAHLTLGEAF